MYLFSHTAVGWNANFVLFRNISTAVCLGSGFVLFFYSCLRKRGVIEINLFIISYILFTFWSFISYLWSADRETTWDISMNLIRGIFFVCPMSFRIKNEKDIRRIICLFVLYVLVSLGYVYATHDFTAGVTRLGYGEDVGNIVNILARIGALGAILNLFIIQYYGYHKNNSKKKILLLIVEVIIIVLMMLCGSRSGIIAVVMGGIIYAVSYFPNVKKIKGLAMVLCGLAIFIYLVNKNAYLNVLFATTWGSLYNYLFHREKFIGISVISRSEMIMLGMQLWIKSPLLGWGMGSFEKLNPYQVYAHNNYVEILSGVGFIGFLLYYIVHAFMGYILFRISKKENMYRSLAFSVLLTLFFLDCTSVVYSALYNRLMICILFKICQLERIGNSIKWERIRKRFLMVNLLFL